MTLRIQRRTKYQKNIPDSPTNNRYEPLTISADNQEEDVQDEQILKDRQAETNQNDKEQGKSRNKEQGKKDSMMKGIIESKLSRSYETKKEYVKGVTSEMITYLTSLDVVDYFDQVVIYTVTNDVKKHL